VDANTICTQSGQKKQRISAPNREFVESFENSSFTRPSGGVFEVKFAKIRKMKKGSVEVYLNFIVTEFRH